MPAECEVASCGVIAVGRCATCRRAMCTSHRAVVGANPVADRCVECQRIRDDDRALRSDRARQAHAHHISALAGMPAGVDRLVRTVQYLAGICAGRTPKSGPLRFEPITVEVFPDLARACPDLWPDGPDTVDLLRPPWNSSAVAAWFVVRAQENNVVPNAVLKGWVTTHRSRWGGHHEEQAKPLPSWRFFEGSLNHIREEKPHSTEDCRCDAYVIAADGRVLRAYDTPCQLGARALASMGFLLWGKAPRPWDGL
jgi:hypothetical protein